MKYIIFLGVLLLGVPAGIILCSTRRSFRQIAAFMMVFFTFAVELGAINFFSNEFYRGTSRGMEISLVDLWVLVLGGALFLKFPRRFVWVPRGGWAYGLYFLAALLSVVNAESGLFSFFELWKMGRMWLMFVVMYNYLLITEDYETIIFSFCCVGGLTFGMTLYQKYLLGRYQPSGLFPHQNSMAMYMGMIGPILLSMWLNLRLNWFKVLVVSISFFLVSGAVMLTFSRGAMFFYPLACLIVLVFSLGAKLNPRKIGITLVIGVCGVVGIGLLLPSIINRIANAPESSKNSRIHFASAAVNMANDKVLGVGINNWGIKINPPYRYAKYRIELNYPEDFKDGLVETIYLMTAAECGWWGLGTLLLLFVIFLTMNVINLWTYFRTPLMFLPLGILGGLFMNYCQSTLEWVLKQTPSYYELMIIFAMIASMRTSKLRGKQNDG